MISTNESADAELLAEQKGIDVGDVKKSIEFQDSFYDYALALYREAPEQVSAFWVDPVPGQVGHIRFVGEVPGKVMADVEKNAELSNGNVVISGDGNISLRENRRRASMVAQALEAAGNNRFLTYYDVEDHAIHIEVKLDVNAPELSIAELHIPIEQHFQSINSMAKSGEKLHGRAAILHQSDLRLKVMRGEGEIMELDAKNARGGNQLKSGWIKKCTSGWSIRGNHGTGIITAAHCAVNKFDPESGLAWQMDHIRQHRGLSGDVEYHTTARPELGQYYSSEGNIRSVYFHRSTASMQNVSVCIYGRASNSRNCSHTITATGVTANIGGVLTGNLARTDNDTSIGGDSGGGWSWDNTAFGVHSGSNGTSSWFTTIEEAMDVLDITVLAD